ncbi:hypothetical protein LINGRAHAP2_LOCUS36719 [Linum grandiflorum]
MAPAATPPGSKEPSSISGTRRPASVSSSASAKDDREIHQAKKKARPLDINQSVNMDDVVIEDVTNTETPAGTLHDEAMKENMIPRNAWSKRLNSLFVDNQNEEEWYIAESDSEDVAMSMREEDDEFDESSFDPLCPDVLFTAEEKTALRRVWRSALVVKGLGRRVPYTLLAPRLNFLWAKNGPLQISDLQNGCYLVRFRSKVDYEGAISGGPWMLGDTYLTVHQWFKGFDPWKTEVKTAMAWVQLPDLPIEFYNTMAVKRIASCIGHPVRIDKATEEGARGKYARVCVEVDLTKPLLSKYKLEGKKYLISYEGLKDLCTICGKYGAPEHLCKCQMPPTQEAEMSDVASNPPEGEGPDVPVYGDWMKAKGKYPRKPFTPKVASVYRHTLRPESIPAKTNRFQALSVDDEGDGNRREETRLGDQSGSITPAQPASTNSQPHELPPKTVYSSHSLGSSSERLGPNPVEVRTPLKPGGVSVVREEDRSEIIGVHNKKQSETRGTDQARIKNGSKGVGSGGLAGVPSGADPRKLSQLAGTNSTFNGAGNPSPSRIK